MDYLENGEEKKEKKTMTNEEALDYFEHDVENLKEQQFYDENDTAIAADLIAIKAIEKQIPKEHILVKGWRVCPVCKTAIECGDYCEECGQRIYWPEVDDDV